MPRTTQRVNQNNFSAGKISDSNPINPAEGGLRVAENVDISLNGRVGRRLGIEIEDDFNFPNTSGTWLDGYTTTELSQILISNHRWEGVNEDSELNFRIFRVGNDLYIYDENSTPYSDGYLGKVDISSFIPEGVALNEAAKGDFSAVSGKGVLFCTGTYYNPFYLTYTGSAFTTTAITVNIRDFEGVDDGLDTDEQPESLSTNHLYNLYNQGWPQDEVRVPESGAPLKLAHNYFFERKEVYPSNSDIWYFGNRVAGNFVAFDADQIDQYFGNTPAPKGAFIYNFLDASGRASASGIGISDDEIPSSRSRANAFYAGRLWMQIGDSILYSKIIEDLGDVDIYHPEQDPTAEDLNQVLATDGGTISAVDIGTVLQYSTLGRFLVVFSTKGIFTISGTQGAFTADDQSKQEISKIRITGPGAVVSSQNAIYFWADEGIFRIVEDTATGFLVPQDVSKGRISTDYNSIPPLAKKYAQGVYSRNEQRIYWSYSNYTSDAANDIRNKYTDVIVYDLVLDAFWDYRFSNDGYINSSTEYPIVAGLFKSDGTGSVEVSEDVVVGSDVVVDGGTTVNITYSAPSATDSSLSAYLFIPDATENAEYRGTFAKFTSRSFKDWDGLEKDSITTNTNFTGQFPVVSESTILVLEVDASYYSTDGEIFTKSDLPFVSTADRYRCLATNNDADAPIALVMGASFNIHRSTDGASWTQIQTDITGGVGGSTTYTGPNSTSMEINGQFVHGPTLDRFLVVIDTGFAYSDDDGDTWVFEEWTTNHSSAFEQRWHSVEWVSHLGLFIACAPDVTGLNQIMYSADGISWTLASDGDSNRNLWTKVVNMGDGNGVLVGGGVAGGGGNSKVVRSLDSISWSTVLEENPGVVFTNGAYSSGLNRVVFSGSIGEGFYTDDAGDTWSAQLDFFPTTAPKDMIYSFVHNKFYAVGSNGVYSSTTGIETPWPQIDTSSLGSIGPKAIGELVGTVGYTPGDYKSVVETLPQTLGEPSIQKGATYVHTYFDYIRGGYSAPSIPEEFDS